jgi:hypothetical protein
MFDDHIIEILKSSDRNRKFIPSGEPIMLKGGLRYRAHPLPEMDFQPDTLAVGEDMYKPEPKIRRIRGGQGHRLHDIELANGIEIQRGGSMKSVGKALVKGLKKVGKVVAPIAKDVIVPVVKDFATKQGRKMLEQQLAKFAIQDALPVAEEAAPLLLAAGRKKRQPSDKMIRRAHLVKQVMSKLSCSLPMASKYIKDNQIEY